MSKLQRDTKEDKLNCVSGMRLVLRQRQSIQQVRELLKSKMVSWLGKGGGCKIMEGRAD